MRHLFILLMFFSVSCYAQDCQVLYQQHLKTDMKLNYKEFDQTMGNGFRALIKEGLDCHQEAAQLIEKYIEVNQAKESSLRWHVAQSWGHAGDYLQAIEWSKTVLIENEDFTKRELRWNDFVLANIAFFEKDKATLTRHSAVVALAKDKHFGNELNRKFLNSLIENFDQSYNYATKQIKP